MAKMYKGNRPPADEGWQILESIKLRDKTEWCVCVRDQAHTEDWKTYKIFVDGKSPNKGNYWMVFNIKTGQIGYGKDYINMRENRPDLHQAIERIFSSAAA